MGGCHYVTTLILAVIYNITISEGTWLLPLFADRSPFHIRAVYQTYETHQGSLTVTVFYEKTEGVEVHWTLGTKDVWSPPLEVRSDHFVWSSCGAMKGDRYECEATLHTEEAHMIDGYTFILLYRTNAGMLMQVEPILLTEGVPRDVCQCGDPTVVHLVSYPTWYLYPPSRLPHRRHQDIHLAWSFEGRFSTESDYIEVIRTVETPRHIPGGLETEEKNYQFLYRENGEVARFNHIEVSVAKRHEWMGMTPVDVDVIIYGATEDDNGVYSVRFGTDFLADWGHQWSSVMVYTDDLKSVFPQGRHNPRAGVQVDDCNGNLTYNSLPLYPDLPNCLVCSAGGYNVSLVMKKDGKPIPRSDARGNELRTVSYFPDSVHVYYYFADPSPEDSAPYVCTAMSEGYYVGKAIWVEYSDLSKRPI